MNKYYLLIAGTILLGCFDRNNNKISPAELVKSREIRKVSEAEILQKGSEIGKDMLAVVDSLGMVRLKEDSAFCDIVEWKALDSLMRLSNSKIEILNKSSEDLNELELQLLEAYQYNLENDIEAKALVQKLDNQMVLYAYAIDERSKIFKYCLDSASRNQAHMWSLKIPVKFIINQL